MKQEQKKILNQQDLFSLTQTFLKTQPIMVTKFLAFRTKGQKLTNLVLKRLAKVRIRNINQLRIAEKQNKCYN